jgi:valyl-tRNA synthetase
VGLPTINIMAKDGSLNDKAGAYAGLDRFAARELLWADMERAGLVIRREPYTTRCGRGCACACVWCVWGFFLGGGVGAVRG